MMRPMKRLHYGAGLVVLLVALVPVLGPRSAAARKSAALIAGFPAVKQWYNLSCEYAAAAAVTLYWGRLVSQADFLREVPQNPNPHDGFRGNIYGPFGGITDYGVYAEALVPVLARRGYQPVVIYNDLARLKANLRVGNPAVVWITAGRQPRPLYTASVAGASFRLVPGEHTAVAYGYDSTGIDLMDVGNGGYYHTDWASFLRRWGYFEQMALIIPKPS